LHRLLDDRERLEQYPDRAQLRRNPDQVGRVLDVPLGQVAVHPQDAALDEATGVAEVGHALPAVLAAAAARPGRPADVVAGPASPVGRARLLDLAERLVAEHQPLLARRWRAVSAGKDLAIGAAHADAQHPHADAARAELRRRYVGKLGRAAPTRIHD